MRRLEGTAIILRDRWLWLYLLLSLSACSLASDAPPRTRLTFPDGKSITVELAATPAERNRGLMFRKELETNSGMLFVFPKPQVLQFWMKNTFVDLDMVFLDAEGKITAIHAHVPRSSKDTPEHGIARRSGWGQFVLELPAGAAQGRGLKVGNKLGFKAPKVPL